MILGLGTKIAGGLAALLLAVNVGQYVHLRFVKADLAETKLELDKAAEANKSNQITIEELGKANAAFALAQELNDRAAKRLKEQADEAQRNADKARGELARRRELDRRAPDCAVVLDRSLAACPELVRRLFGPDAR